MTANARPAFDNAPNFPRSNHPFLANLHSGNKPHFAAPSSKYLLEMTSEPIVPLELVELILDVISASSPEGKDTLSSFSRTCQVEIAAANSEGSEIDFDRTNLPAFWNKDKKLKVFMDKGLVIPDFSSTRRFNV
ncbi:hypothetical protein CVT26_001378 [Gymnopilus dilepis]|uniref:Uncharacterized protein n=1 Tax=Gymnopilus dilepis TaxID=231916 RepID=A0A409YUN6_9AGAR|nr:hypothetical protein CVT26_001378 [Gymnopilus dilepis]